MRDDVAETYIRQVIEAQDAPEVTIAWQGGEPTLMGLPFFRHVVALAESYRRPDQRLLHTVQTNGTLLDEAWAEFFADKGFLVGISIDGPGELHDKLRVDKRGQPTLERVLRGLEFLRRADGWITTSCAQSTPSTPSTPVRSTGFCVTIAGAFHPVHPNCRARTHS